MAKENISKARTSKHGKFIPPGMLAKKRASELKIFQNMNESPTSVAANQKAQHNMHRTSSISHVLIMHYHEEEYVDKDFNEDSTFLDVLRLCKKFCDIYSVHFTLNDDQGEQLNCDKDIYLMVKDRVEDPDIHVYFVKDKTSPLLSFKLPEDNFSLVGNVPEDNPILAQTRSISSNPKVTNVRIMGVLKVNEKVTVSGDVIGGSERASTIQMFVTISKNFGVENDFQSISLSQTQKVFIIPLEAVGHYLVAKYTPIDEDGKLGPSVYAISDKYVKDSTPQEKKKVRGENMNKKVGLLKAGEKLEIEFYNDRGVGENHECWSRHLGKVVRDINICPQQFQTWKNVTKEVKSHLWGTVKECFEHKNMEIYREETLEHMGSLWTSWRSKLFRKFVKPCKTKAEALRNRPQSITATDWTWLVNEKFYSEEFQKMSKRNKENRGKATEMPHRTGSKPHRAIMYDMGGKDGNSIDYPSLFFETRKKNGKLQDQEAINKYEEIVKTTQSNPSLSNMEVVDKCFGPQTHNRVFGYGGGMKRKKLSKTTYEKELEAKIKEKEEENCDLKKKFLEFESRLGRVENAQSSSTPSAPNNIDHHEGAD